MTPSQVVFDCVVYLQAAARADGPARACLRLVQDGHFVLLISPAIRAQVEDVLNRPRVRHKFQSLTDEGVAAFLADIDGLARTVEQVPAAITLARDPKDEPYLNLAVSVGAEFLLTWDNDLLHLMEHSPDGKEFRERVPRLAIVTPPAFLEAMRRRAEGAGERQRGS